MTARTLVIVGCLFLLPTDGWADRVKPSQTQQLYSDAMELIAEGQQEKASGNDKQSRRAFKKAHKKLSRLLALSPRYTKALTADVEVLLYLGRSADALKLLNKSPKTVAKNWKLKHLLGIHLFRAGKKKRGVRLLEQALRRDSGLFDAHYILVGYYYKENKCGKAIKHGTAYLKLRPKDPNIMGVIGNCHLKRKDLTAATKAFERVLAWDPKNLPVRVNLGNIFFQKRQYNEAIAIYNQVLKSRTDLSPVHYNLAASYYALERWTKAEQHFGESSRLEPKRASSHYFRGLSLVELDRPKQAVGHLQKAASLDRTDPWPLVALAEIAQHRKRLQEAADYAESALKRAPRNERILVLNGMIARKRKLYAKALQWYDRALASSPRNSMAYAERGFVRFQLGHTDEGIADLETARTFDRRERRVQLWLPVALTKRSVVRLRRGENALAKQDLLRAVDIRPTLNEAVWNLALLYDAGEAIGDAQSVVRRAIQKRPAQPDLALLSAYLHVRGGQYDLALQALKRAAGASDTGLRWLVQGAVHSHFGEYDAAINALQQAASHGLNTGDTLSRVRLDRAVSLMEKKRVQAALTDLRSMELDSRASLEPVRMALMAVAHLRLGHGYNEANRLLERLRRHPNASGWGVSELLADVDLLLGYVRYRLGEEKAALKAIDRHLATSRKDAQSRRIVVAILDGLAERDHAARRFGKAAKKARRALRYAPRNARIQHNEACIQYGRGEYKKAAKVFRLLMAKKNVPEAPLNLALYLDDVAGKGGDAALLYREYIESGGTAREIARRRIERKERIFGQ